MSLARAPAACSTRLACSNAAVEARPILRSVKVSPPTAARLPPRAPRCCPSRFRASRLSCVAVDAASSPDAMHRGLQDRNKKSIKWERVMLKVSGEALAGAGGFGLDNDVVQLVAREIAVAVLSGVQVAVVVGGGNFFRGADKEGKGLDRASADYMGMLATVMNCLSLQAALENLSIPNRVQTAIEMKEVAEPYVRRRAIRHLEKGRVVIFGAGTGNPFFTTDTAAALRAAEINAQVVLKATKVDGVYNKDPQKHDDVELLHALTYNQVLEGNLNVMDATAITLCKENSLPVVVFNMFGEGNISRALRGRDVGSIVCANGIQNRSA